MSREKVMLVEDDCDIREILQLYLQREGYTIIHAEDGTTALRLLKEQKPDLIILDVVLPGMDGFEVCQLIRQQTTVPILFLSSKEDEIDKILGHKIGGDDYITKPFSPALVTVKVQGHLRRHRTIANQSSALLGKEKEIIEFPGLCIDKVSCVVKANGATVQLSAKEYQLICLLAENPDRVFSVKDLFELIWGEESLGDNRTVMVHISNLRKKVEPVPEKPMYIVTVRGIGYKFIGFRE
ncbi:DNA-binding response regulator, OmpR family, contains REC and winged-helix (wHTH) domain [Litchfieldia salsa]|uniref:DNA-binding response regulator, OmpR family, contains REC and winged-helix (WHTH) domain n=1 Tax=Litchfieldia salsa TaxID=930152 RepID=A0A1H0W0M0_9BACI|nr:response regulator transcription factor [Litchfieldia salsa]SDP84279.1 DNA-binding response regulator, OmpR family, contains REC and winged-helix (wHTH) domain [Litchfieldia salsa]